MTVTPAQLAATLIRRKRDQLRRVARRRDDVLAALTAALRRVHAMHGPARSVWLIGSLAWGTFGEGSDVDLVVEGLDADQAVRWWSELSGAIPAEVDLMRLEELSPGFRERVTREGKLLDVS